MQMPNCRVSIVIPCYNNGYLLSKMIDCVLQQTYSDWELIIVDDCSTDNTQDIVREYAKKDIRIKFLIRDREPKGAQTCRNIGMNNVTSEFIVIFDADDLVSNTCIEKRVEFMINNSTVDYASFPAQSFTDDAHLPAFFDEGKKYGVGDENTDLLSCLLKADYSVIVVTNIYRTSSLANLRWDEKVKVYQDFDLAVSVALSGLNHRFSALQEIDYFYRRNDCRNTISSNFVSQEKCDSTVYLFSKTLDKLKLRSDYNKRKKELGQFIVLHYERLIVDGVRKKANEYLSFCKKYYCLLYVKLLVISILTSPVKKTIFRKLILHLCLSVFFFRKQSIGILKHKIKMVIKKL